MTDFQTITTDLARVHGGADAPPVDGTIYRRPNGADLEIRNGQFNDCFGQGAQRVCSPAVVPPQEFQAGTAKLFQK